MTLRTLSFFKSPPADLTIVCITNADIPTIETFVRVQLQLGVKRIRLFVDGNVTKDHRDRLVSDTVSVQSVNSQVPWLKRRDIQRRGIIAKQIHIYNKAYMECDTAWFGACDIDEFFVADEPLKTYLDRSDPSETLLRGQSHEATWAKGEDARTPFSASLVRHTLSEDVYKKHADRLYGENAALHRPAGTLSHVRGKFMVRTGLGAYLRLHHAEPEDQFPNQSRDLLRLIHFDAISEAHWHHKMAEKFSLHQRRPLKPGRRTEQVVAIAASTQAEREKIFDTLYKLNDHQVEHLTELGAIFRLPRSWSTVENDVEVLTAQPIFDLPLPS